jgi:hypothetical protein
MEAMTTRRRFRVLCAGVAAGVALAPAASAQAVTPAFTGPTKLNTGPRPAFVTTADVDGDGRLDLVTANAGTATRPSGHSVLLNRTTAGATTPRFSAAASFPGGNAPVAVTAADLNADGRPDLITANLNGKSTGNYSVLMNTTAAGAAAPSFSGPAFFGTNANPAAVTTADVNGDGRPDVIGTEFLGNNKADVLLNTTAAGAAKPNFATPKPFPVGAFPSAVAAADVNGDGRPDIVTAGSPTNTTGAVSVLLNTTAKGAATASFGAVAGFPAGNHPYALVAADLNADGRPDFATANAGSKGPGGNSVLVNRTTAGAPLLGPAAAFATGNAPTGLTAADLDGDRRPDLISANILSGGTGGVTVLMNTTARGAKPAFSGPSGFDTAPRPIYVTAADLNADGRPDIATADDLDSGAAGLSVLLNAGPIGSVRSARCRTITVTTRRVKRLRCTIGLVTAAKPAPTAVAIAVTRTGRLYAAGHSTARGRSVVLTLAYRHAPASGTYVLRITTGAGAGRRSTTRNVHLP